MTGGERPAIQTINKCGTGFFVKIVTIPCISGRNTTKLTVSSIAVLASVITDIAQTKTRFARFAAKRYRMTNLPTTYTAAGYA